MRNFNENCKQLVYGEFVSMIRSRLFLNFKQVKDEVVIESQRYFKIVERKLVSETDF